MEVPAESRGRVFDGMSGNRAAKNGGLEAHLQEAVQCLLSDKQLSSPILCMSWLHDLRSQMANCSKNMDDEESRNPGCCGAGGLWAIRCASMLYKLRLSCYALQISHSPLLLPSALFSPPISSSLTPFSHLLLSIPSPSPYPHLPLPSPPFTHRFFLPADLLHSPSNRVWYGIVEFNVPLDTVEVISETGALEALVHLPFSNGGPAT